MVGRSDAFTVPWYSTHALLVLVESSLELSDGAFCDSVAIVSAPGNYCTSHLWSSGIFLILRPLPCWHRVVSPRFDANLDRSRGMIWGNDPGERTPGRCETTLPAAGVSGATFPGLEQRRWDSNMGIIERGTTGLGQVEALEGKSANLWDDAGLLRSPENDGRIVVDYIGSLIQRVAANSVQEIDQLISYLGTCERVRREIVEFATLSQAAMQSTKLIAESLSHLKRPDAPASMKEIS